MHTLIPRNMFRLIVALAVAALAIGGVAYATDGNARDSAGQAWAHVDPHGGSPLLVKSKNVVSVSSPSTGIYCLHLRAGIDLKNTAPMATQEQNLSTTLGFVTARAHNGTPNVYCPVNDLQVTTWDASNPSTPTPIGTVAFDVIVP